MSTRSDRFVFAPAVQRKTCLTCARDTSMEYYEVRATPGRVVCPDCFRTGAYPAEYKHADFDHVDMDLDLLGQLSTSAWTAEETYALVDALDKYGESSWDRVAEHVGTKTAADCVARFLRLPNTFLALLHGLLLLR